VGTRAQAELVEHVLDVRAHRGRADHQLGGDLLFVNPRASIKATSRSRGLSAPGGEPAG